MTICQPLVYGCDKELSELETKYTEYKDKLSTYSDSVRKTKEDGKWSIGFWIHPERHRKGYAKEAAIAIVKFGFEKLRAESIEACCATWNIASKKIFESLGMKFIKEIDCGFKKKGKCVPEFDYEITKEEWSELNN